MARRSEGRPPPVPLLLGGLRSALAGALHLRRLPCFPSDAAGERQEPRAVRAEVLRKRPADLAELAVLVHDLVPHPAKQAKQKGPDEQGVEIIGLRRYAFAE